MANNKHCIQINGKILAKELKQRKVSRAEASIQIGYGSSYVNNCILRGYIAEPATKLLKSYYNIDFEKYKYVKPNTAEKDESAEKAEESKETANTVLDYSKLNDILYDAVFRAVRDALAS